MQMGGILPECEIAYETWGELNEQKSNAILLFTGLSASAHAKSHNRSDVPGWWEAIINRDEGIDINTQFVVCFNHLGGCFGSTGPSSINPKTRKPYGPDFPPILIGDMVEASHLVVEKLGISKVACVLGASMGGMLAMEYAARFNQEVIRLVVISASGRPGPQSIAFRYVQRQIILNDATYGDGWYYEREWPIAAMAVARQVGNITYRSRQEFNDRFGRSRTGSYRMTPDFEVESYLHHMGWKLGINYDANSFLFLSKAMDLFSLGYEFPTYETGVERILARTLIIGVSTDMLFPIEEQREIFRILKRAGRDVSFQELDSATGHDAFLVETDFFKEKLSRFLAI